MKTPYKYSISLKNTVTVANIKPTPRVNINKGMIVSIPARLNTENDAPVAIITNTNTIKEIKKFTKFEIITLRLYIYLGTYTFFIIEAFDLIETIAALVDPEKKSNINLPVNK
ncbi:hypothetical protein MARBORIA2_08470 [Methanobrevibacter arboriphilus]|uniref:Uncharacterized protein n=1 Tax=Methanobrevibacter arboriphilus TaxID=39441 RepID=A0ACA8R498_METAZ|nr:hypothetical protein MarbSA_12630 [Methanobrevibacter arboriphilus]GLI11757.1 hypothetical protein MARBORIA2_08470 [Methanobrevibacter arboriphilus]